MTTTTFDQDAYRGRDDDVSLNSGTFTHALNTNWTQDVDTTFRLRLVIQETGGGKALNSTMALYVAKNGAGIGSAAEITTASSNVILVDDSQSIADGATTTQVIGTGTYVSDESGGWDDGTSTNYTGNLDFTANTEAEVEFCLQIVSGDVADEDTLEFYVHFSNGTQLDTYTRTPSITVNKVDTSLNITETEGLTVGESTKLVLESFISASDGLTVGESVTMVMDDMEISASESVAVADVLPYEPYTENVVIGESVTVEVETPAVGDLSISVSDGVTVGESTELVLESFIAESDGLTVGESASLTLDDLTISASDGLTVGENVTMSGDMFVAESDGVTVGESATVEVTSISDLSISEAESVTVGESASLTVSDPDITASDNVTLGESVSMALDDLEISAADGLTVTDSTAAYLGMEIVESDGVSVGESASAEIVLEITSIDGLTVTDNTTVTMPDALAVDVSDGLTVGESVSVDVPLLFLVDATISDAALYVVTISDAALYGVTVSDADLYPVSISELSRS